MSATTPAVVYPDSDGKPMSDNTRQFRWIHTIQGNLDLLFRDRPDVFVAGNNLIYAVEGRPKLRAAPDVYVAFGRPKGDRGSYKVWEEGGVFPQVVFEVLSPGNRRGELARKFLFYERFGAEEYYVYDPDRVRLDASVRGPRGLQDVGDPNGYVSPRLGIRFELSGPELVVRYPDGRPFLTTLELGEYARRAERDADAARREAAAAKREAEQQRKEADEARRLAETATREADRFRALLRAAGIDPDAAPPTA